MTDERYVFMDDIREKKKAASGAAKRKGSSPRGKKCTLPSDNMTAKQIKKLSGEEKNYKLGESVKWDEFKTWPDDLQREYIKGINKKFNAPVSAIAKMMGVSYQTMYLKVKALKVSIDRKSRIKLDMRNAWSEFSGIQMQEKVDARELVEEAVTTEEPSSQEYIIAIKSGSLELMGRSIDVLESLKEIIGDAEVIIKIDWTR